MAITVDCDVCVIGAGPRAAALAGKRASSGPDGDVPVRPALPWAGPGTGTPLS